VPLDLGELTVRITYDPDVDAVYIMFGEATPLDSHEVLDGLTIDVDAGGRILGIEVLDARARLGEAALADVEFERLE
jgi:uncharacterized protein YuzE